MNTNEIDETMNINVINVYNKFLFLFCFLAI